jgi:uncharacterized membrane protein YadS
MEISFGGYAMPVVLSIILGLAFKFTGVIPDKWKALVSVSCGIGLGMLGIAYQGLEWSVVNVVDFGLYGLMTGAAAVGLYELQRTATRPRE